jgi:hypothetical protein
LLDIEVPITTTTTTKNVTVSLFLLSTNILHGPLAGKLSLAYMTGDSEPASEITSLTQPAGTRSVGE